MLVTLIQCLIYRLACLIGYSAGCFAAMFFLFVFLTELLLIKVESTLKRIYFIELSF